MDPNPENFPILSFVMTRLPPVRLRPPRHHLDVEQPPTPTIHGDSANVPFSIVDQMPHLKDPELLESMRRAVSDVAQTNSVLRTLGPRPNHEAVDMARAKLAELETNLYESLEEVVLSPRPGNVDRLEWRTQVADKEHQIRREAERERSIYKSILQLDAMHDAYGTLLKEAEERLLRIYNSAGKMAESSEGKNEEVMAVLEEAQRNGLERLDLSNRRLRILSEALGKIEGLVLLHLSNNQLQVVPDSLDELKNLEVLNISSNLLASLPNSIGLLQKLKILNVSGNKLQVLPNSICHCRSLLELDASMNSLLYLPANFGQELVNVKCLFIQLNKIHFLPNSVGGMKSLRHLDAHFNQLCGLPDAIGRLTKLEVLNLSSNFSDLKELPETFGELTNLKELDLSYNQIHALPDTFGRLINLTKLNLEHNPLAIPPRETVEKGVEAVQNFMTKRSLDILLDEEKNSMVENKEQEQTGWLTRSTSWLTSSISLVAGTLWGFIGAGGGSRRDPYLDEPR